MNEDRKAAEELIGEFYATIERNVESDIGSNSILGALVVAPLGHPFGELVGIGRALYLATQSSLADVPKIFNDDATLSPDQIRHELREISMRLFYLSAKQGNRIGKFYNFFYRNVYENRLLESLYNKENGNKYNEASTTLAELQSLANEASHCSETNLVNAYAYYFGCGVAKDRDKSIKYLESGLLRIDLVSPYEYNCALLLMGFIGKEVRMEKRTKVFISYSHKDAQYEEELRTQLQGMAYSGIVEYWDDSHLKPGDEIDQTIKDEMARAKFIIMLVSPDYMASWYVRNKEFIPLIEAARDEGATIIWVPVRQVLIEGTALDNIEGLFDKNKSLASTRDFPERSDRDVEYTRIAKQIFNALNP